MGSPARDEISTTSLRTLPRQAAGSFVQTLLVVVKAAGFAIRMNTRFLNTVLT